jgi:hypothetical protein
MSIPLIIFLYIYYGFLVVWGLLFLAVVYHLLKFGLRGALTIIILFIFVGGALFLLNASYLFIAQVDWQSTVTIFNFISQSNPTL